MSKNTIFVPIATILMISMLCATLSGCHKQPDTTTAGPAEPSTPTQQTKPTESSVPAANKYQFEMVGALVNAQGEVQEKVTLSVSCNAWTDTDGWANWKVEFNYPENYFIEVLLGRNPNNPERPWYCTSGFCQEKGSKDMQLCWIGIDFKGRMIVDWNDEKDVYLIVSTASDANLTELWADCQGFFDVRPEQWPESGIG